MADHDATTGHGEPHAPHVEEHPHPGAREYLGIAIVLTVLTAVEVAVFYIPAMKPMLVPTLLTLSAVKFALVGLFYMHLKFDSRLFSWLFVVPMILIAVIVLALLKLFGHW
jgi:cytochrome c oxidase subunit 4